jgi:hypothetical protein
MGKPVKRSILGGAIMFEDTKAKVLKAREQKGRPLVSKRGTKKISKKTTMNLNGSVHGGSSHSTGSVHLASAGAQVGSKGGSRLPVVAKMTSNGSSGSPRGLLESPISTRKNRKNIIPSSATNQGTSTIQNGGGIKLVDQKNPSQESVIRINDRDDDWL